MTHLGIQISSAFTERLVVSLVQSGAIGKVTRVHSFSSKKWGDMGPVPQKEDKIPEGFDWDLWLGPAKKRSYSPGLHPFSWRGYWDYGTGALGDMACHILDVPYKTLKLLRKNDFHS